MTVVKAVVSSVCVAPPPRVSCVSPAAAAATKGEVAWRLLHDASLAVGKEQAVLLPELRKVGHTQCCLDSQRIGANEAFGNTSHIRVLFHWAAAGRPTSIPEQHRYQNIDLQRCIGSGIEPSQLRSMRTKFKNPATSPPDT